MAPPTTVQTGYITTLEDVACMIQKAQVNLKKCPKQRLTEGYVKARLQTIDDYWQTFQNTHYSLMKCTSRKERGELPYFLNEEFYKFEELYLCLKADLSDLILKQASHSEISLSSLAGQSSFAKLPRIELKQFSGKYEDWPSFQDLFTALVHNNTSLNDVQKLHYLKTSVSGEAEMLLRNIETIESNYAQAWELLKGRFGNKRMIVNSLLKRLFGQKKVSSQSSTQIKVLLDTTTECMNSLSKLDITTDSWDSFIIFLVSQKLDTESLKDWEVYAYKENGNNMPTWNELKKFLEKKFRTLELVTPISTPFIREKPPTQKTFHVTTTRSHEDIFQSAHTSTNIQRQLTCTYCNGNGHYIYNCKEIAQKSVEQRHEFVKNNNLCFNCLIPNHNVYKCKQRTTCRVCRRKHHSLLHQAKKEDTRQRCDGHRQPRKSIDLQREIKTAHFSQEQPGHQVLLATAQVQVKSRDGDTHILRALIDQGSEASFVSARAVELLGLTRTNINGEVSGVGEGTKISLRHLVDLSVASRFNKKEDLRVKAYVLKNLSTNLPSTFTTMDWSDKLQTLKLADPTFLSPGKIDLLLGAEVFCQIIEEGLVKMPDGIVAQKTTLGWILSGRKEDKTLSNKHNIITLHVTRMVAEDNDMFKKFWENETDLYKKKNKLTTEEEKYLQPKEMKNTFGRMNKT